MSKKAISFSVGSVLVLVLLGGLAEGGDVTVSPVNTAADLDLSGNILYAINFGNNGNPKLGGVVFSQDQDHANVSVDKSAEGVGTAWGGIYPNTGDTQLDMLLIGCIWKNNGAGARTTSVAIANALTIGTSYQLQLVFYTDHARPMDIIVEGVTIIERHDPFFTQGNVTGKGGSVVKYVFVAGDVTLNVAAKSNPDVDASVLCGLILTELPAAPIPFADYGSGTTIELISGKGTWQINWGQGPWTWSDNTTAQPLLGSNVSSILALQTTAPAKVSADLVATLPVAGTLTLSAHDQDNGNGVIGTMVLSGTGVNIVDLNASRVIVDEGSGMGLAPFHAPGPELAMTLDEATGVFAYIQQTGDWRLELAGLYVMPLMKEGTLQANILAALGGKVPLIGGLGTFALSGQYDPVESMRPKSFCEYGTGVSVQLGAGGALWNQNWTGGPWSWYMCDAPVNGQFLGKNVVGTLETTTAGQPLIDEGYILRFDFGGKMTLTAHSEDRAKQTTGQIIGDVKGLFVADMNAVHATFDDQGNIIIAFGATVHNEPDATITVVEKSGVFSDIQQAGPWRWYVKGTIKAARIPSMTLQQNILAGLQKSELLLGAQEEFVLTGWYYRQ